MPSRDIPGGFLFLDTSEQKAWNLYVDLCLSIALARSAYSSASVLYNSRLNQWVSLITPQTGVPYLQELELFYSQEELHRGTYLPTDLYQRYIGYIPTSRVTRMRKRTTYITSGNLEMVYYDMPAELEVCFTTRIYCLGFERMQRISNWLFFVSTYLSTVVLCFCIVAHASFCAYLSSSKLSELSLTKTVQWL